MRSVAAIAFGLGLGLLTGCGGEPAPPNVLVVMVDTLRADHLGVAGFDGEIAPRLDAFAAESIRFDGCVAPAPWTSPSIASTFTSLHAQNHCVANGYGLFCEITEDTHLWSSLSEEAITLAELFRDGGYDTAGFVGNWVVKKKFGFGQGFDTWVEPEGEETHGEEDAILIEQALAWLEQRDSERPFLLYLHLMDVHAPYRITPEDLAALRGSTSLGEDRYLTEAEVALRPVHLGARINWPSQGTADRLRNWRLAYAAGVRRFDRLLGGLLDRVREQGHFEDTVIVITSDHGEEFLEHGAWEHGKTYYNEATRVPLMIRLPGPTGSGRLDSGLASLLDLMPTLAGLAGLRESAPPMQGSDLGPRLRGAAPAEDRWVFSSALPQETASLAAFGPRYKMILDLETDDAEIYDLQADPDERSDLASHLDADVRRQLDRQIADHLDRLRDFPAYRPSSTALSDEDIGRLRSLGYVR